MKPEEHVQEFINEDLAKKDQKQEDGQKSQSSQNYHFLLTCLLGLTAAIITALLILMIALAHSTSTTTLAAATATAVATPVVIVPVIIGITLLAASIFILPFILCSDNPESGCLACLACLTVADICLDAGTSSSTVHVYNTGSSYQPHFHGHSSSGYSGSHGSHTKTHGNSYHSNNNPLGGHSSNSPLGGYSSNNPMGNSW